MKLHELIEISQYPCFRKMKVESGYMYNFYNTEKYEYSKEWVFVPDSSERSEDCPKDVVGDCEQDETAELLKEIMAKVKEANRERGNGIYAPMIELAENLLDNYRIERR
jgi:hypothetical protein